MKLLLVSDMHLREQTPEGRTDENFTLTCLFKLKQILEIAAQENVGSILQAGDFFHKSKPSLGLIASVIDLFARQSCWKADFLVVHGQHDLTYHSIDSMNKSALNVLAAAGMVEFLHFDRVKEISESVYVFGLSYGQDFTIIPPRARFNILVAHAMVGDKPLWPGHKLTGPEAWVKEHPGFDLYLLGDYHYPFAAKIGNAHVINTGCMLRLTRSERDMQHKPSIVVYDTDTREYEWIELQVRNANEVFDLIEKKDTTKENKQLEMFIQKLKDTGKIGTSFQDNLAVYFQENDVKAEIRKIILDLLSIIEQKEK